MSRRCNWEHLNCPHVSPSSRHRRCIHSHSSGWRRTYISSTSVQRCVNSRTASALSARRRLDRVLVDHAIAARRRAAARTAARPARRSAAPAPRAPTSSPPAGRRSRRRSRRGSGCADRSGRRRRARPAASASRGGSCPAGRSRVLPVRVRICSSSVVEARVVERARQHRHRLEPQRVHHRLQLPEAEVAR